MVDPSLLASHLSPLASLLSPLSSHLSPLASLLSPLAFRLSPLSSLLSPLASRLSPFQNEESARWIKAGPVGVDYYQMLRVPGTKYEHATFLGFGSTLVI